MSAFGFINNSKNNNTSHSLSASLLEDLYDSEQLNTFINQSRTFSSNTPSPPLQKRNNVASSVLFPISSPSSNNKKSTQRSYFSFIDDLDSIPPSQAKRTSTDSNSNSSDVSLSEPTKESRLLPVESDTLQKSAFGFIDQSASTPVTKRSIPANSEMKLISATVSQHRLESEITKQINKIQRFYTKQHQIYDQINTLKSKIDLVQKQKDQALQKEDFLLAETLQTQEEKMVASLSELEDAPSLLSKQIFISWQRIHVLEEQTSQLSKEAAECCKKVREERYTQYMKFVSDNEKIHEQKLQEIDAQRGVIASEKSEVAFDLGLWEQAEEDLVGREDDAIHEELTRKRDVEAQTKLIQNEIKELNDKLKSLETQKSELLANAVEVDLAIGEKLKPFANERLEHEQEFERIEIRRRDIEEKATHLDAFDTQVDTEITHHHDEKERGLEEIHALDEQIALAIEKSVRNSGDVLNEILKQIEARDKRVTQYQLEMQKFRETILEKKKVVETLQHTLYDEQQKNIHLDETVLEMQQKLKSLARHKQLAIEARRFQNAAAWANQINLLEGELSKLLTAQNGQQQTDTKLEAQLKGEQNELRLLEQRWNELENEKYTEIKLILETFRDELKGIAITDDNKAVQSMIDLELETISIQLQQFHFK